MELQSCRRVLGLKSSAGLRASKLVLKYYSPKKNIKTDKQNTTQRFQSVHGASYRFSFVIPGRGLVRELVSLESTAKGHTTNLEAEKSADR